MIPGSLIEIGYVLRTHGVKGALRIAFLENIRALSKSEALFFLHRDDYVPFFIAEIEYADFGGAIVELDEIQTREKAADLVKQKVWGLPEYRIHKEETPDQGFLDFIVIDSDLGTLGAIRNITSMGAYDLVTVQQDARDFLLALHPDMIRQVDEKRKILYIQAPEGILDI